MAAKQNNSNSTNIPMPTKRKRGFSIDKKLSIPIFVLTAIAAVVLRIYQLRDNTNLLTGIYINRSYKLDYPPMVIIGGLSLILLVLIFGTSRDKVTKTATLENPMRLPADKLNKNFHVASGILMIVAALTVFVQLVMDISLIITENTRLNEALTLSEENISIFTGITTGSVIVYLLMIFTGFTFLSMGTNMLRGRGISKMNCFFLLFPLFWKVQESFSVFFGVSNETRIINLYSEKLYIIFADIFIVCLFFSIIRVYTAMEEKSTRLRLIFWGYTSALLLAVSVLPRLFCMFTMPLADIISVEAPSISDVGFCIVAIIAPMPLFAGFAYREVAQMTYKEGKRDHWISEIAGSTLGMETMDVEPTEATDEAKTPAATKKEQNIDELF
jgi:hypothetical protein